MGRKWESDLGIKKLIFSHLKLEVVFVFKYICKKIMSQRIQEGNPQLKIDRLDGGGVPIYYYEGKPFTGTVFKNHRDGITLAWEEEYESGYQEGWCRYYYPLGEKR